MQHTKPSHREEWLDFARGAGIVLVVIGHLVANSDDGPKGHEWFIHLKSFIYSFHMPFFMLISGVTARLFTKPVKSYVDYWEHAKKKFFRLLVPFLLLAFFIYVAKIGAAYFLKVDNPVDKQTQFWSIFVDPMGSYAAFLWYIYLLFLFYLTLPIWNCFNGVWKFIPLIVAFAIHILIGEKAAILTPMGNLIVLFLPYFLLGYYLANYLENHFLTSQVFICVLLPIFCISSFFRVSSPSGLWNCATALSGAMSVISLCLTVSKAFPLSRAGRVISLLGLFSFPIYLFNTTLIGLSKAVLWKFFTWHGYGFWIYLPILMFFGLYGPILLKKFIFKSIPL